MSKIIVISRARSGSMAFMELLGCHPQIQTCGEILNRSNGIQPDTDANLCDIITKKLSACADLSLESNKTAFKVLIDQITYLDLDMEYVMHRCGIESAIVIWRKNTVETIVSETIAATTGQWYSNKEPAKLIAIEISEADLRLKLKQSKDAWIKCFATWPIEVRPIFVQYEEFFGTTEATYSHKSATEKMRDIFAQLGCLDCEFAQCYAKRQNPAPLDHKVTNWQQLPSDLLGTEIDVPALFDNAINKRFGLPKNIVGDLVPNREPHFKVNGLHVRVAEPYLPPEVIDYVNDALRTGSISSAGVWPQKLALRLQNLFHVPVAIPCCNGFAALVLALQSAGIKPNDDVIVPAFTMIAVPNAVKFVGANCIFVDNAINDYNPSWEDIESIASPATKAIIIAHTYGRPAVDMEIIAKHCKQKNWVCIEDISECVGIRTQTKEGPKLLGTFGDYACASMYANKIVHSADGGFVIAQNAECGVRLTSITNHGFTKTFHFVHFEASINGKINGLGAAVACGVLDKLAYIISHREMLSKRYRDGLAELVPDSLQLMPTCGIGDTPWVFGVHCQSKKARTRLRQYLADAGIETRDYFFPLHLQPAYRLADAVLKSLPNAELIASTGFYLPTHTNLTEETIDKITAVIRGFFSNIKQLAASIMIEEVPTKPIQSEPDPYGLQLLKRARQCFNGTELFDEKCSIISLINGYCRSIKAFTDLEQRLLGFRDYFTTTLNIDEVKPLSSFALEEVLTREIIAKSINTLVYICDDCRNGYKDIIALLSTKNNLSFYVDNMSDDEQQAALVKVLHQPGCFVVINIEMSGEAFVSRLDDFYSDLPSEALNHHIMLYGGHEELRFMVTLAKKFQLNGKATDIRLYEARVKIPVEQDWDVTQTLWNRCFSKKLKFIGDPGWDHHHQNAFTSAIDQLKSKFHDDNAEVLFISAVEQYICDASETPKQSWIGIIHGIPHYEDQFYVPDLNCLCTKARFRPWLRRCAGLLTLTSEQAEFLTKNLRPHYNFPIVQVWYPGVPPTVLLHNSVATDFAMGKPIDIFFIGSYDRDFEHFYQMKLPQGIRKNVLVSDSISCPEDVTVVERLNGDEYERMLSHSLICLSLKEGGAANTLLIECIMRNVPILAPKIASVIDYIGSEYPFLYDKITTDFTNFVSAQSIQAAVDHLTLMNKEHLSQETFIKRVAQSTVLQYQRPTRPIKIVVDVSVIICSHRRTHHLEKILDSLLNRQKFNGTFEVIIWNNNIARQQTVEKIVESFLKSQSGRLKLISSTENYHCAIRFAMPQLMRSDKLLICDDDIIPGEDYVAFFARHHQKHPNDVLCLRGNYFLPHDLADNNVHEIWTNYNSLRFVDDDAEERLIHYVHADACLIPKLALREVASIEPPDDDFMLIDDYWMSYILNAKFGRDLRKLKVDSNVIRRTDDSDEVDLAMHTRPDVAEARTRMYIHHMCNGWPNFSTANLIVDHELKQWKRSCWSTPRIGMNINSEITLAEMDLLRQIKLKLVRIGIVGAGRDEGYEFSELDTQPMKTLQAMQTLFIELENRDIDVILVLDHRLASTKNWAAIAQKLRTQKNLVGYDLCNEPFTEQNNDQHWIEVQDSPNQTDSDVFVKQFTELITAVRTFDSATPIIIETPFWANIATLNQISIEKLKTFDDNLIVSVHFYQPQLLTMQHKNAGRYRFPGEVPIYAICEDSGRINWTAERIDQEFEAVSKWMQVNEIPVFVGEFGIARDVVGAELYLKAVAAACKKRNLSACLYAFRDPDWEAMDYEFGPVAGNSQRRSVSDENALYNTIQEIIRS